MSKLISQRLIPFGKFIKPHGIKGELKLLLYNKDSNILSNMIKIWVSLNDEFYYYSLESIKGTKDIIVKFSQINDRGKANLLSGKEFFISRDNFPNLDKKNFYLVDIIKFKVFDEKKESDSMGTEKSACFHLRKIAGGIPGHLGLALLQNGFFVNFNFAYVRVRGYLIHQVQHRVFNN